MPGTPVDWIMLLVFMPLLYLLADRATKTMTKMTKFVFFMALACLYAVIYGLLAVWFNRS